MHGRRECHYRKAKQTKPIRSLKIDAILPRKHPTKLSFSSPLGTVVPPHLKFRPDLQGLRAIAIALVVLNHAGFTLFSGGFIGVDVFFVLSGFLITGLIIEEYKHTKRIELYAFYSRRIKRLLPALLVMLVCAFAAVGILLPHRESLSLLDSAPYASTWTSNIYFAFREVGYFDRLSSKDVFLHTWSLGVEEQFYLFWPLLLIGLYALDTRSAKPGRRFLTGLAGLGVVSFSLSCYLTFSFPDAAYYLMPARLWQFALGALIQFVFSRASASSPTERWLKNPHTPSVILTIGLGLIAWSGLKFDEGLPYPGVWSLLPSLGAAFILLAGGKASKPGNFLRHPALVWLGNRSYSWYLWHWPVLVIGFSLGVSEHSPVVIGLILLSLAFAAASYRLIELPFWKGRFSHGAPKHVVLAGMASIIAASVTVNAGHTVIEKSLPPPAIDLVAKWHSDLPIIYTKGCDSYSSNQLHSCLFGSTNAKKVVVLVGDSIAAQWFSAVHAIFPEPEWRTIVLTKSSCAMVDKEYYYGKKLYTSCTEWRNAVIGELAILRPNVVIMGESANYGFSQTDWVDGSARVIEKLSKNAHQVLVIPGTPFLPFDGPNCVHRHRAEDRPAIQAACSTPVPAHASAVASYLKQAAAPFPNAHLLNLNDIACPTGACSAMAPDGVVVYRDSGHLSDSFVKARIPAIRQEIERIPSISSQLRPVNQ